MLIAIRHDRHAPIFMRRQGVRPGRRLRSCREATHQTMVSVTSMLPRVAFEYGQTICALSTSA